MRIIKKFSFVIRKISCKYKLLYNKFYVHNMFCISSSRSDDFVHSTWNIVYQLEIPISGIFPILQQMFFFNWSSVSDLGLD